MKNLFHISLVLVLFSTTIFAQTSFVKEAAFIPSEVLVRLKPHHQIETLMNRHQNQRGASTDLKIKKVISEELGIYLLSFNEKAIGINSVVDEMFDSPEVFQVQKNHKITWRSTTPNDPQYNQQWQYDNTGQSGGTSGADIDMDLAWDITTGGTTTDGDEIVVCIIDDGLDTNHPDFGDNLWINTGETPNNGVDDDNNGYVDDRLGWNAYSNNDDLGDGGQGGGHGTPVAGIVGAKGNNGVGVSGVSWNVKLMIVVGGGNEAEALAAYAYPHKMRQMYNQSNGQNGAFVVATNASWGVDNGQPSNAPLWCDFYDDLGSVGILNAGATANANTNVDNDGDLPTACSSDYIISVTNMNHNDTKVTDAGYGATTIDLGAFGQGTWTVAAGGGYEGFGGTSGATPHVAGTIGLLYAVDCPSFIALSKSNPGAAALAIKQYIMDGTDSNASLQGITVSGGRLNVHGAIQQLQNNCSGGSACARPVSIATSNVSETAATVTWTGNGDSYNIRYREVGTTNWTTNTSNSNSFTINNLTSCKNYEIQIQAVCNSETSTWSSSVSFNTLGCTTNASLTLTIIPDDYGSETTWSITSSGITHESGGPYTDFNSDPIVVQFTLAEGCYDFNIADTYGDGMCCEFGNGSYALVNSEGTTLVSGGSFGFSQTQNFCVQNSASLPVELADFKAFQKDDEIIVAWTTLHESEGTSFELWESSNGQDWTILEKKTNRFSSIEEKSYEVFDRQITIGSNYYRLDQYAKDGQLEQSQTRNVVIEKPSHPISIFPNPVTDQQLFVKNAMGLKTVRLVDLTGKEVWRQAYKSVEMLTLRLDLPSGLSGIYSLILEMEEGIQVEKVVVH